eukprot:m51a1_g14241 hypothetical protein (1073) ;mRNA; f:235236-239780
MEAIRELVGAAGSSLREGHAVAAPPAGTPISSVVDMAEITHGGLPLLIRGACKDAESGWNRKLFERCWEHDTAELSAIAAENPDKQFQAIDCPPAWQSAISSRLTPALWGPGDMEDRGAAPSAQAAQQQQQQAAAAAASAEGVVDPFAVRVLTGGSQAVESCLPSSVNECGALRFLLYVYGSRGASVMWMVVSSEHKAQASEMWRSMGKSCSMHTHFMPVEELAKASFPVYVLEQAEGDLVIVPPECVCQAVTSGGNAVLTSWFRHNPFSLEVAYERILPAYRRDCITPPLNIKMLAYVAMSKRVEEAEREISEAPKADYIQPARAHELEALLRVVGRVLASEWIDLFELQKVRIQTEVMSETFAEAPASGMRTCTHCKSPIFNRCYKCNPCTQATGTDVQYCFECVMEGQRCDHLKLLVLMQSIRISSCRNMLHRAIQMFNHFAGGGGEDLIANLCRDEVSAATVAFNQVQLATEDQRATCHQCKLAKPRHRMVFCTNPAAETHKKKMRPCCKKFCMSCLWNRYMIKHWECLKRKNWSCPYCLKTCNCSACLRKRGVDPNTYELPFIVPQISEDGGDANEPYKQPRPRLRRKSTREDVEKDGSDDDIAPAQKFAAPAAPTKASPGAGAMDPPSRRAEKRSPPQQVTGKKEPGQQQLTPQKPKPSPRLTPASSAVTQGSPTVVAKQESSPALSTQGAPLPVIGASPVIGMPGMASPMVRSGGYASAAQAQAQLQQGMQQFGMAGMLGAQGFDPTAMALQGGMGMGALTPDLREMLLQGGLGGMGGMSGLFAPADSNAIRQRLLAPLLQVGGQGVGGMGDPAAMQQFMQNPQYLQQIASLGFGNPQFAAAAAAGQAMFPQQAQQQQQQSQAPQQAQQQAPQQLTQQQQQLFQKVAGLNMSQMSQMAAMQGMGGMGAMGAMGGMGAMGAMGGMAGMAGMMGMGGLGMPGAMGGMGGMQAMQMPAAEQPPAKRVRTEDGGVAAQGASDAEKLIWARVGPYSPWFPARYAATREATPRPKRCSEDCIPIFFFGDNVCMWVRPEDIKTQGPGDEQPVSQTMQQAVEQAIVWANRPAQ